MVYESGSERYTVAFVHALTSPFLATEPSELEAAESALARMAGLFRGLAVDHARALVALALDKPHEAVPLLHRAVQFCLNVTFRPAAVWAALDLLRAWLQHRTDDLEPVGVCSLHAEATAIASELAMGWALFQLTELDVPVATMKSNQPALSLPDDLTAREVEVLQTLAAGKSNKMIADELFISRSTVATHVVNIYRKIGAANRVDAAAYAKRKGLAG